MENQEIKVKITGNQIDESGEENKIEFTTEAKYYKKANAQYIVYEESELSGMEGCTTRLKISENTVQMKRFGKLSSNMIFDQEENHKMSYPTPYGHIDMVISTNSVVIEICEGIAGSQIELDYDLQVTLNNAKTKNELKIELL